MWISQPFCGIMSPETHARLSKRSNRWCFQLHPSLGGRGGPPEPSAIKTRHSRPLPTKTCFTLSCGSRSLFAESCLLKLTHVLASEATGDASSFTLPKSLKGTRVPKTKLSGFGWGGVNACPAVAKNEEQQSDEKEEHVPDHDKVVEDKVVQL